MTPSPHPAPTTVETLYRDHVEFAWRTARYLGVPQADAQDVVHEVFIIVQRRIEDLDPDKSARAWIGGITRRVVLHHKRKHLRVERREAALETPLDATPRADDAVSYREAEAFLAQFLERLPQPKREAFVLGELERLTAIEIGEIVGESPNTVSSRLRSARKAFQASVDRLDAVRRREGG
ncbi:MAG: sigma-70 family RNA polymerase sigma factor [Nannocystaceae bacterium]|nr:sigma-70 family RNA polymerase sigma factor [Nannocystaceae bacterium]